MAEIDEEVTLTATVSGRVQGVGFRQFVWSQASHLPVVGWVRNLPDGSVEVVAQGSRPAVEALRLKLLQGPRYAYIADVSEDWAARIGLPDRFEIR